MNIEDLETAGKLLDLHQKVAEIMPKAVWITAAANELLHELEDKYNKEKEEKQAKVEEAWSKPEPAAPLYPKGTVTDARSAAGSDRPPFPRPGKVEETSHGP